MGHAMSPAVEESPIPLAILALEDGTIWRGEGFGAQAEQVGEVVFNTALTGYQEVVTDPSYRGQIVVMTATHIGNVGVNPEDAQSERPRCEGFVVRELSPVTSNWRSRGALSDYLAEHGVPGLAGVNTRALTLHLRTLGALRGALSTQPHADPARLVEAARAWPGLDGQDLVLDVSCRRPYDWPDPTDDGWQLPRGEGAPRPLVLVWDYGVKYDILRRLVALGAAVRVLPADFPAAQALPMRPHGLVLSNGPGDPAALPYTVETCKRLLETGLPLLGICLGHQILGQALGASTFKLKFGHHGANQPVRDSDTGGVRITAQNHGYAVDPERLPPEAEVTEWNLNDDTVEGLRLRGRPVWSVQYHPEAGPGPHDGDAALVRLVQLARERARWEQAARAPE